jgi:hypothetical protein
VDTVEEAEVEVIMKKVKKALKKRIRVKKNLTSVAEVIEVDVAEVAAVEEVASNHTETMKMQMVS